MIEFNWLIDLLINDFSQFLREEYLAFSLWSFVNFNDWWRCRIPGSNHYLSSLSCPCKYYELPTLLQLPELIESSNALLFLNYIEPSAPNNEQYLSFKICVSKTNFWKLAQRLDQNENVTDRSWVTGQKWGTHFISNRISDQIFE